MARLLRRWLLVLGLLGVSLLTLPTQAAPPQLTPTLTIGDVYLALGDSLGTGAEAAVNNDNLPGYPDSLYPQLKALNPDLRFENLAQSDGETSISFLVAGGQLEQAETFIAAELAAGRRVSPVTLTIGGNDVVAVITPGSTQEVTQTLTTYRQNVGQILDRLDAALTVNGVRTGDLVLATYYNPYPGLKQAFPSYLGTLNADPDIDLPRFNQIIIEEAAARCIKVAPVYEAFPREASADTLGQLIFVRFPYNFNLSQLEQNFDFHPREAGHRLIATTFAQPAPACPLFLPLVVR